MKEKVELLSLPHLLAWNSTVRAEVEQPSCSHEVRGKRIPNGGRWGGKTESTGYFDDIVEPLFYSMATCPEIYFCVRQIPPY